MIVIAIVLWTLVIVAVAFGIYVRYAEPARLEVTWNELHLQDLPETLEGLRIVHLSDFHCQPDSAIERSSRGAVKLAMEQKPDLIVISGDLFETCEMADKCAWQIEGLKAPLGVWAVPGNHDRAHEDPFACMEAPQEDVATLRTALDALGINLLANENKNLRVNGATIAIAGSDEFAFGRDDVARALRGTSEADLVILITHTPDLIDDPASAKADLILCGHTHGGQIRLPWIGAPWAPVWRDRRRSSGLLRAGEQLCYVNRGVASATRARFNCRPEVAVLTLAAGQETQARDVPTYRHEFGREAVDVEEVAS